jgi:hypothetical protein
MDESDQSNRSNSDASQGSTGPQKDTWTDEHEGTLKMWGEEAKGLSWMHGRCEKWFNVWDRAIGVPAGVLAIMISISIFAASSPQLWLRILQGVIALISGALVFLQNFLDFGKRARSHAEARMHYESHGDSIEAEMSLLRVSRSSVGHFFRTKQKERNDLLLADYPPILDRYIEQYKIKFSQQNIAQPLITDALKEIVIHTDINSGGREPARVASGVVAEVVRREADNPLTKYELNRYHEHEDR